LLILLIIGKKFQWIKISIAKSLENKVKREKKNWVNYIFLLNYITMFIINYFLTGAPFPSIEYPISILVILDPRCVHLTNELYIHCP
jgi:hypothetical protein